MVMFKDLSKSSKDLLTKEFSHETPWDVEYVYKGDNINLTNKANVSSLGSLDASTNVKYTVGNITSEVKVTSEGGASWEFTQADSVAEGLSLSSRFERRSFKTVSDSLNLTAEYLKNSIHSRLMINPLNPYFSLSTCLAQGKSGRCKVGGEINGTTDLSSLDYSLGGSFTQISPSNQWTLSFKTVSASDAVVGKVFANLHGITTKYKTQREVAAEINYSLKDGRTLMVFGGLWYLNPTMDTFFKARVSHEANIAMSLTHKFSDAVTATLGTEINGKNPSSPDAQRFGIKLKLSA